MPSRLAMTGFPPRLFLGSTSWHVHFLGTRSGSLCPSLAHRHANAKGSDARSFLELPLFRDPSILHKLEFHGAGREASFGNTTAEKEPGVRPIAVSSDVHSRAEYTSAPPAEQQLCRLDEIVMAQFCSTASSEIHCGGSLFGASLVAFKNTKWNWRFISTVGRLHRCGSRGVSKSSERSIAIVHQVVIGKQGLEVARANRRVFGRCPSSIVRSKWIEFVGTSRTRCSRDWHIQRRSCAPCKRRGASYLTHFQTAKTLGHGVTR
ncbi:hypothetical protein BJ170DRAFT_595517 [Xylariales sp. AK1849]|nr:hypothetical protein BJ170DRAFT_595517 [Xylariales sp. AK1849]